MPVECSSRSPSRACQHLGPSAPSKQPPLRPTQYISVTLQNTADAAVEVHVRVVDLNVAVARRGGGGQPADHSGDRAQRGPSPHLRARGGRADGRPRAGSTPAGVQRCSLAPVAGAVVAVMVSYGQAPLTTLPRAAGAQARTHRSSSTAIHDQCAATDTSGASPTPSSVDEFAGARRFQSLLFSNAGFQRILKRPICSEHARAFERHVDESGSERS